MHTQILQPMALGTLPKFCVFTDTGTDCSYQEDARRVLGPVWHWTKLVWWSEPQMLAGYIHQFLILDLAHGRNSS
jgi:hypothetical protein